MTKDLQKLNEKADLRAHQMESLLDLMRHTDEKDQPGVDTYRGLSQIMDEFLADIKAAIDYSYSGDQT